MSSYKKLQIYQKKLLESTKEFRYRYERYNFNYSIAIVYSPEEIDFPPMSNFIRVTDVFIVLDNNTYAIVFDCTDDNSGTKAANILLMKFQGKAFDIPLYSAIVTASNYSSPEEMNRKLFCLLNFGIAHNMNQEVIDHSQITSYL
jgi:hypothetical protein